MQSRFFALLGLLLLCSSGCTTAHHHALLVTSSPSAQRFEVSARDHNGSSVRARNGSTGVTPHELRFPQEAALVDVRLVFSDGEQQEKTVSLHHTGVTYEVTRDPILGIPLVTSQKDQIQGQIVHFDRTPLLRKSPKKSR